MDYPIIISNNKLSYFKNGVKYTPCEIVYSLNDFINYIDNQSESEEYDDYYYEALDRLDDM